MTENKAATAICTYRIKDGQEQKFEDILKLHWPTLRKLGLVTEDRSQVYRGKEAGRAFYVEILDWVDAEAPNEAEKSPEVIKVWEQMGALVEAHGGRPAMEFPHVERLDLQ